MPKMVASLYKKRYHQAVPIQVSFYAKEVTMRNIAPFNRLERELLVVSKLHLEDLIDEW